MLVPVLLIGAALVAVSKQREAARKVRLVEAVETRQAAVSTGFEKASAARDPEAAFVAARKAVGAEAATKVYTSVANKIRKDEQQRLQDQKSGLQKGAEALGEGFDRAADAYLRSHTGGLVGTGTITAAEDKAKAKVTETLGDNVLSDGVNYAIDTVLVTPGEVVDNVVGGVKKLGKWVGWK